MKAVIYWLLSLISFIYTQTPYDELITNWSKKNKIFLHPNITLHKTNPNEYYFKSRGNIDSNTLILSIPKKTLITSSSLYSKLKNKKLIALWDKLLDTESDFIKVFSTKEMMFIAMIMERSMRKQKGNFYSKYKAYLNAFPDNMDNFPMYYTNDELILLKKTHFYNDLILAQSSLEDEEKVINRNLNHSMMSDDYWKYRVLTLANSLNITNETTLVPLLNLFMKDINDDIINSHWKFDSTAEKFEIYTQGKVSDNQMIILQGSKIPNAVLLLFYGFTYEKNEYISKMNIDVIHPKFKEKLDYDPKFTLFKTSYDLSNTDFISDIFDIYRLLAVKYNYGGNDDAIYRMMIDNLEYYLKEYDNIKDSDYSKLILSKRNRVNIRRVIETEKRLFRYRINYLQSLIAKPNSDL